MNLLDLSSVKRAELTLQPAVLVSQWELIAMRYLYVLSKLPFGGSQTKLST